MGQGGEVTASMGSPLVEHLRDGPGGEAFADAVTVTISAAVSLWAFFPVLKVVLRDDPAPDLGGRADGGAAAQ